MKTFITNQKLKTTKMIETKFLSPGFTLFYKHHFYKHCEPQIWRKIKHHLSTIPSLTSLSYLTPFNFRPPLIFGRGWPKIRGTEIFPKPLYNIKQKRKNVIYRRWPKLKGAELGEGGRKLKGPKIKGAEN